MSADESSLNGQVSPDGLEEVADDRLRISQASDQQPSSSDGTETQKTDHKHHHPKMVEPKGNCEWISLSGFCRSLVYTCLFTYDVDVWLFV